MLEIGLEYSASTLVDENLTAKALGSGDMDVYATPAMVALMENAAMNAVSNFVGEGNSTVGTAISVSHIKATALGGQVSATATLTEIDGRKLTFKVIASDSQGEIGSGTHIRFIVDREKFLSKVKK